MNTKPVTSLQVIGFTILVGVWSVFGPHMSLEMAADKFGLMGIRVLRKLTAIIKYLKEH